MWKFLRSAFLVLFLCVTAAGLWCGYEAYTFLNVPPETPGQAVSFDVTPGMTISRAATALKAKNVITDPFRFRLLARYREAGGKLKAGRFLLNTGWTPDQVLNELISGKPVLTRVTIPEGLTWWQTAAILEQAGLCTAGDFADVIRDPEFLRHYGIPFYVAAPLSTIDRSTPDGKHIPIEERPASEVTTIGSTRITPEGVPVFNFAFDVTPADLITGIITDKGLLTAPYDAAIRDVFAREER